MVAAVGWRRCSDWRNVMKRVLCFFGLPALVGCLMLGSASFLAARPDDGKVEVKVVKYDALRKTITDLKGKIVVVDFWADT
jgi:hypothetical protein